jgi:hypothetical protein
MKTHPKKLTGLKGRHQNKRWVSAKDLESNRRFHRSFDDGTAAPVK